MEKMKRDFWQECLVNTTRGSGFKMKEGGYRLVIRKSGATL